MVSVLLEVGIEQQGHHTCLPVIQVENVRLKVHEVAHEIEYRSLEETISLDIENIFNIDLVKVEIIFIIHEVEDGSVLLK